MWAIAWVHVHMFVSKWFLNLVTLSLTAWVLLVYICEKSVSKSGTPTFAAVILLWSWLGVNVSAAIKDWNSCTPSVIGIHVPLV